MDQSESGHSSRCLLPKNRAKNREGGTEFSGLLPVSNTIWKYLMVEKAFFGIRNAVDQAKQRLVIQMDGGEPSTKALMQAETQDECHKKGFSINNSSDFNAVELSLFYYLKNVLMRSKMEEKLVTSCIM